MLSPRALAAYFTACALAAVAFGTSARAVAVPWLENGRGQRIGLRQFWTKHSVYEFPDHILCERDRQFCASWRTAAFLLYLQLGPAILALIALLFSWAFHHRKKTVVVVKYLVGASLILQIFGLFLLKTAIEDVRRLVRDRWGWYSAGGSRLVVVSVVANIILLILIIPFRRIVRNEVIIDDTGEYHDDDSADEDSVSLDEENISIPEGLHPDQVDFYVFNTLARRRALAASRV